jgi:hypothetical protein
MDEADWLSKFNDQGHYLCNSFLLVILTLVMHFLVVQFETQSTNAWVDAEPDAVIEEAQELLGRSGWGAL